MKVKAIKASSTGYIIKVTPEHIENDDQDNGEEQEENLSRYAYVYSYMIRYMQCAYHASF